MSSETRPARRRGAILLEFLGSMNLAITLLVAISVAAVIGTVLQQNQPYPDYVAKFGPFWFEIFKSLGLYDLYRAGWFLTLLGLLLLTTGVCIYRNSPTMLREMRHFRLDVQEKSLRGFHQHAEWRVDEGAGAAADRIKGLLAAAGFKVRAKEHGDRIVIAGMRGSWNRLGYLFTHLAIVVICVGGLVDGNIPLKVAESLGRVEVESRDIPASEVPEKSVLSADNAAFRGNVRIPEGSSADFVYLGVRDGYLLQRLPFAVELKDFRVEHYPSGQPKSFESDVAIHDPDLKEPLVRTIAVNHPLVYKGYAIYQASFSDGGSRLSLRAWSLDAPDHPPLELEGAVYGDLRVGTRNGPLTLELTDFKPYNVVEAEEGGGKAFQNNGPSVVFKLRNASGEALEYVNYMFPVTLKGRAFLLSGMRATPGEPYRYLYLPVDSKGGIDRFMALRGRLLDIRRVQDAVMLRAAGLLAAEADPAKRRELAQSMVQLTLLFAEGGMEAIMAQIEQAVPAAEREKAMESYIAVLQSIVGTLYIDLLKEEGVKVAGGIPEPDALFFDDALEALAALGSYGSPIYLQVADFRQIEASGLQITRAPGQDVVYLGCVMLMAGVFFMFYLHHRRLWVSVTPDGDGARLLMAGSGNRDRIEFGAEFEALRKALQPAGEEKNNDGSHDAR